MKKVGIYSGTFDPIHAGHMAFARKAIESCGLDKVFFLVEPRPRRKQGVRALEHREAMVRLAIAGHEDLGIIMLEQANFSVEETLPKLLALFDGAELHMLLGADVFAHLNSWPHVKDLLKTTSFIVGMRSTDEQKLKEYLHNVSQVRGINFNSKFFETEHQGVSSSKIRLALKRGHKPEGLLPETENYIKKNNLYSPSEE